MSHIERELKLNGWEPDDEQINTVTQHATKSNTEKPKPTSHHCKKPGHNRKQCRQLKREKDFAEKKEIVLTISITTAVAKQAPTLKIKMPTIAMPTMQTVEMTENR